MNWIQGLLITSIVALLVYLLWSRRNAQSKAWVKVGYLVFVLGGVYAVLRPNDTPWWRTGSAWTAAPT